MSKILPPESAPAQRGAIRIALERLAKIEADYEADAIEAAVFLDTSTDAEKRLAEAKPVSVSDLAALLDWITREIRENVPDEAVKAVLENCAAFNEARVSICTTQNAISHPFSTRAKPQNSSGFPSERCKAGAFRDAAPVSSSWGDRCDMTKTRSHNGLPARTAPAPRRTRWREALMSERETPVLNAVFIPNSSNPDGHYGSIAAWCPWCEKVHFHGAAGKGDTPRTEHRIAHCSGYDSKSPFLETGYGLAVVGCAKDAASLMPSCPMTDPVREGGSRDSARPRLHRRLESAAPSIIRAILEAITGKRFPKMGYATPRLAKDIRAYIFSGGKAWEICRINEQYESKRIAEGKGLVALAAALYGIPEDIAFIRIIETATGAAFDTEAMDAMRHAYREWNAAARASLIVPRWCPDGKREAGEWVALNPRRSDRKRGSFKVNLTTGKWGDWASGDRGGDLISLAAYLFGLNQAEAAKRVADMLGISAYED